MPGFWDIPAVVGATAPKVIDTVAPAFRTRLSARNVIDLPGTNTPGGMNITGDTSLIIRSLLSGELRPGLDKGLKSVVQRLHRGISHLRNTNIALSKGMTRCSTYLWLGETHRAAVHGAMIRSTVRAAALAMSHEWPYHQLSAKAGIRVNVYMEHALAARTYVRSDDLEADSQDILNNSKGGDAPTLVTREEEAVSRVNANWIEQRSRFMLDTVAEMTTETNAEGLERVLYVIITGGNHTSHINSILTARVPEKPEVFTKGNELVTHAFFNFEGNA
jgi:hypothetical protein